MTWTNTDIATLMVKAVDSSANHVESGGLPFVGLVIGQDGFISSYGVNQVHQTGDPSAHAEIVAMRAAMRDCAAVDLAGAWLLATGEPCGLCYHFALAHRIERVYIAVDADTAADWGFDYRGSYPAFSIDRARLRQDGFVHALPVEAGLEPFRRFTHRHRIPKPVSSSSSTETKGKS